MYYIYVLESKKDKKLYIGHTNDLKERLAYHNKGFVKSTMNRRPFELVYYEASYDLRDVTKREKYLKTTYGHRYLHNRLCNYLKGKE